MEEQYIGRQEHEEFRKRMEDENHRQNRRIEMLEENVLKIGQLTTTVAQLTINMECMLKTQEQQDKRLKALEGRDGEKWRSVTAHVITTVIGIALGYIFTRIGM